MPSLPATVAILPMFTAVSKQLLRIDHTHTHRKSDAVIRSPVSKKDKLNRGRKKPKITCIKVGGLPCAIEVACVNLSPGLCLPDHRIPYKDGFCAI